MASSVWSEVPCRCLKAQLEILAVILSTRQKSATALSLLLKRLLGFGNGSQERLTSETLMHTNVLPSLVSSASRTSPTAIKPLTGGAQAELRHLELQRLSRWTEYIIFWLCKISLSNSFKLYSVASYILFYVFFVCEEELVQLRGMPAILCSVMNHHIK